MIFVTGFQFQDSHYRVFALSFSLFAFCCTPASTQSYLKDSAWSRNHRAWGAGLKARSAWRPAPKARWFRVSCRVLKVWFEFIRTLIVTKKKTNLQKVESNRTAANASKGRPSTTKKQKNENIKYCSTMASKERFSSITEEELQQIKIDSRAESTVKATKFWSSLFEDYLREKNIAIDLKTCTADELAAVL